VLSREKTIAGVGLLVAFAAGLAIGGVRTPASAGIGTVLLAGTVAVWAVVAVRGRRRAGRALAALGEARRREQVLSELGAALLATGDPERMRHLTVTAADELLRDCRGGWAAVLSVAPDGDFVVTDRSGRDRLPAGAVPDELLARLAGGAAVTDAALSSLVAGRPVTLLPLLSGEHFSGVFATAADEPVPAGVTRALEAVRMQASLALQGEAMAAELAARATRDPLTGLGNRALLRDRLRAALARARRSGRPVGVLLLDLQGFRKVNEVHGHDAGDELLRVVADRLLAGVRTEDTVGRLGGDQFAVIAEDLRTAQDIVIVAERIVVALGRSVPVSGRVVRAPASVGVALSHPDTESPDQLLREAEAAMSAAKRSGGSRYHLHGASPAAWHGRP
jgi:diguanylate cyclase (GGDEF)-like protein